MTNYNWNIRHTLELGIGISCCPFPAEAQLIGVWNRHRNSLLSLIASLPGVHVIVENSDVTVKIKELNR